MKLSLWGLKSQVGISHQDHLAAVEQGLCDALAIDKGAVGAVQVYDDGLIALALDAGMTPGDGRILKHDVVVTCTSDSHCKRAQGEDDALLGTADIQVADLGIYQERFNLLEREAKHQLATGSYDLSYPPVAQDDGDSPFAHRGAPR